MKNKNNILKYYICLIILLSFLIISTFFVFFLPPNESGPINIKIKEGMSLDKIGKLLKNNKIIKSKPLFILYSRITGDAKNFKAGNFLINRPIWFKELNKKLKQGEINQGIKITIPEGFSITQIAKLFEKEDLIKEKEFLKIAKYGNFKYDFLKFEKSNKQKYKLEGFLFPDTYFFDINEKKEEMFCKMLNRFEKLFWNDLSNISKKLNISQLDLVTLASIVEKEAVIEKERAIIASVFYNRLNKKMKLESCATVQYALGKEQYKSIVTLDDIKINNPYNTYKNYGLPPGPIASPGKNSLNSVLYPINTNYLFFVAKGDGSHYFSLTFEEHQNKIENNL